jgi:hypothetical protein
MAYRIGVESALSLTSRRSEALSRLWMLVVGGDLIAQCENGDTGFETACSAEQMSRHRFRRLTKRCFVWSPKVAAIAVASARSPSGVEVAWALRYWMFVGVRAASCSTNCMTRRTPRPSSGGALGWKTSEFAAYPTSSARMVAPRRRAWVRSSRMRMPAPSPTTSRLGLCPRGAKLWPGRRCGWRERAWRRSRRQRAE